MLGNDSMIQCLPPDVVVVPLQAGVAGDDEFFRVVQLEQQTLQAVARRLDGQRARISEVCRLIALAGEGTRSRRVGVSGVGKAGLIARKVAATLVSTGTGALFLHPVEALHGDLGILRADDLALLFSYSGETAEVVRLARQLRSRECSVISITRSSCSTLASLSDLHIELGEVEEACHLGLAPTSSTLAMLVIGDALAVAAARSRGFTQTDFGRNHPAGALGLQFIAATSIMRTGDRLVCVQSHEPLRDVVVKVSRAKTGAAILCSPDGGLVGILTDGDLRRAILHGEGCLQQPVKSFATIPCHHLCDDASVSDAMRLFNEYRVEDLPLLCNQSNKVLGLVCLKDCATL